MIQPLTVVYLHTPSDEDATLLQDMEYGLSDAFRAFCREVFAYDAPFDFPRLKLVTAATPKELDAILCTPEGASDMVLVTEYAQTQKALDEEVARWEEVSMQLEEMQNP